MNLEEAVKEEVREVLEMAKDLLQKDKHLLPVIILLKEMDLDGIKTLASEVLGIDPKLLATDESKDALVDKLKQRIKKTKEMKAAILIMEVWTTTMSKKSIKEHGFVRPSTLPERREAISVAHQCLDENNKVQSGIILQHFHREGDRIIFGEKKEQEKWDGRFNLFE